MLIAGSCGGKESIPQTPQLHKMTVDVVNKIANGTPVTQQEVKGILSPDYGIWMAQTASQFPRNHSHSRSERSFPIITPDNNLKQLKAVEDWMATNWSGVCDELTKNIQPCFNHYRN